MLKFEKKSQYRPASISIRTSEGVLNPSFLQALFLALTFHLLGFLIFHVQPFQIKHSETIFPPVQVNIEFGRIDKGAALAAPEEQSSNPLYFLTSKASTPKLPSMPQPTLMRDVSYQNEILPTPFLNSEEGSHSFDMISLGPPEVTEISPSIEIKIDGALAKRKRLDAGPNQAAKRGVYHVKVEDRTGKIFWFDENVDPLTASLLSNLQFERNPNGFITEGLIEIRGKND